MIVVQTIAASPASVKNLLLQNAFRAAEISAARKVPPDRAVHYGVIQYLLALDGLAIS